MKRIAGSLLFAASLSFGAVLAAETRVLGLVVRYTDTSWPAHSTVVLNDLLFGGGNSLRSYYNEGSGGAHRVTGEVHPQVLTINQARPPGKCTLPNASILGEAMRTARIDPTQYTMIAVVITSSQEGCNGGVQVGFNHFDPATRRNAHMPAVVVWSLTDRFILHETGHAHRLGHAKTLSCGNEVLIGACSTREYGDFTDTMANGVIQTHGVAMRKILGWGRTITHSTGTATYTIGPAYTPGVLPNGVEVRLPDAAVDGLRIVAPISLWIEYRRPKGFDSPVKRWPGIAEGALVKATGFWTYVVAGREYAMDCRNGATCLIDMTPGDDDFYNAALPVGATWADKHTGASIRVDARTEETLTVTVSVP